MNDAVKQADKIVCEYMKRMGYRTDKTEKKSRRILPRAALWVTLCIFTSYILFKLIL